MENTSGSLLHIPDEIVYDILSFLPAKSLQRFKLVSKPWGSLISDPNFAELHLQRANTSQDENPLQFGQQNITMGSHPCFSFYSRSHPYFSFYYGFDLRDQYGSNRNVVTLDRYGSSLHYYVSYLDYYGYDHQAGSSFNRAVETPDYYRPSLDYYVTYL
ncbi:putative F-box protein At5g42430 [Herrania umbratica]|uniref:F-box protein At5g42430 n=1 Tax=Herrania umbratica TaxID=108875 RepID=A0A6J1AXV3_9ROSI|nr:putative F-box protein At5g42430 [Herrania umbratica]